MLGMKELNYGITGTLVAKAGLNEMDERDFLSRSSLIDSADVAIVFGGTNDYFGVIDQSILPRGTMERIISITP